LSTSPSKEEKTCCPKHELHFQSLSHAVIQGRALLIHNALALKKDLHAKANANVAHFAILDIEDATAERRMHAVVIPALVGGARELVKLRLANAVLKAAVNRFSSSIHLLVDSIAINPS